MREERSGIGARMKAYEAQFTRDQFLPTLPVIVRIDGRAFHSWTRHLERPFDGRFVAVMKAATGHLVKETGAVVGYTQSDEITLVLHQPEHGSQIFFDGRAFKLVSVCASLATAHFNELARVIFPDHPPATFDCRAFQVPSRWEAVNCLIWREQDARRNSILMFGQAHFSHNQLHGMSCTQLLDRLISECGIDWEQQPDDVRKGTYVRMDDGRPAEMTLPPLQQIANGPEVIFERAAPVLKEGQG